MKTLKKILSTVLIAATLFSLSVGTVCAEEVKPETITRLPDGAYKYTVTFDAGAYGKLKSSSTLPAGAVYVDDKIVIEGLVAGTEFTITANDIAEAVTADVKEINGVQVAGKAYYVKGFNVSGQDNSASMPMITVEVYRDMDYVIAYGIQGDSVEYIVHYVDKNGNTLRNDDRFIGNKGDKPIVMYRHIEGYAPEVKAYTETLTGEKEHEFTFVYDKVPTRKTKEVVTEETEYNYVTVGETVYVDGGVIASNVTGGGNGAGGTGGAGGNTEDADGADDETGIPGLSEDEIVDLDDEETPLANVEVSGDEEAEGSSVGVYIGLGLLAVIIAAVVAYIVSKKRKVQE